jgi:hypothetical protein
MVFNSTQEVLVAAVVALLGMPIAGFPGAVFLRTSQLLLDSRPLPYWTAYKVTTLSAMAAVVFLVPAQLVTTRLGSVGLVIDVVLSVLVMALFYSRWIADEQERPIGFGDAFWLAALESGLWILVVGVFFGLGLAMQPTRTLWGVALAITCAALLVGAATVSLKRPAMAKAPRTTSLSWKTDDILALYRHAAEELDAGRRDAELWALATVARSNPDQQRDWYLAERVKQLKELAEEQLRREGVL